MLVDSESETHQARSLRTNPAGSPRHKEAASESLPKPPRLPNEFITDPEAGLPVSFSSYLSAPAVAAEVGRHGAAVADLFGPDGFAVAAEPVCSASWQNSPLL